MDPYRTRAFVMTGRRSFAGTTVRPIPRPHQLYLLSYSESGIIAELQLGNSPTCFKGHTNFLFSVVDNL